MSQDYYVLYLESDHEDEGYSPVVNIAGKPIIFDCASAHRESAELLNEPHIAGTQVIKKEEWDKRNA